MSPDLPTRAARPRIAWRVVVVTLTLCVGLFLCRAPLRARYWAWQLAHSDADAARVQCLALLVQAGDASRWAAAALRADPRADVRQYAVLVAQSVRADWATNALLDALDDPSPDVRHLAAVALGPRGDEHVLAALETIWRKDDGGVAVAACEALARQGTPAAVAQLERMGQVVRTPELTAALVDALDWIGSPACVPPLLALLDDDRVWVGPTWRQRAAADAAELLAGAGWHDVQVATDPGGAAPATIAERAAEALGRITGLRPEFSSADSGEARAAARAAWSAWRPAEVPPPPGP